MADRTAQRDNPFSRRTLRISIRPEDTAGLQRLPWHKPLSSWGVRDARFLQIKSGISRHVVRFLSIRGRSYAVKETSAGTAEREFRSYVRLHRLGIPALMPVGTVVREEGPMIVTTNLGSQADHSAVGYMITGLLEYALPDSYLFTRTFSRDNRRRIWDAIIRLFVKLHCAGAYWGDASLANMMILFVKEPFPEIGTRTVLKAVLADAETVEFHSSLSERLRRADIDYFLESMLWTEADMKASGMIRDPLMTRSDQHYILNRYLDLFEVEREEQSFELLTHIDVDALLGSFMEKGQAKVLLKHIYEHKWYISEQEGREIPLEHAARDWYAHVFKPVLQLFKEFDLAAGDQDITASGLYLDIMLHKYYLSEKFGRDVGLITAFGDYASGHRDDRLKKKFFDLAPAMKKLRGLQEHHPGRR